MKMSNQYTGLFASLLLHGSFIVLLLAMGRQLASPGGSCLAIDFSIVSTVRQPAMAQEAQMELLPIQEVKPPPVIPPKMKKLVKKAVEPPPAPAVVPDPESLVAMEEVAEEAAEVEEELIEAAAAIREPVPSPMAVMTAAAPLADMAGPVTLPVASGPPTVDAEVGAVISRPLSPAELYLKSHFLYIKDGVQNSISYPLIARRMGWEGRVVVCFVVCADGNVTDIRVVESSGFAILDKNAVATIRQAAPFPKPPVRARLTMPISFRLG